MNPRIQLAIENYEDALLLSDLRKKRILEELSTLEDSQERLSQVAELYWTKPKLFQVAELGKVLGLSKWDFIRLLREFGSNQEVTCSCIGCGKKRTRKATSRSDVLSPFGKSFVCEDCKEKREADSKKYWQDRETRLEALKSLPYKEYLQSDHWKVLRLQKLRQARYRCQLCNSSKTLHVHHRTYENKGQEKFADLIVLCEDCHENFHSSSEIVQ